MASPNELHLHFSTLSPPSWTVWLVCEELGLDYKEHPIVLTKGEHMTEEFKAISYIQKVPCIQDGDFKLGESRAIIEYLCDKYATGDKVELCPKGLTQRALMNQVLWADCDSYKVIDEFVGVILLMYNQVIPDHSDTTKLDKRLDYYEHFLNDTEYMASDHMTIADICVLCTLCVLEIPEKDLFVGVPKVKAWMKKMKSELKSFEKCAGSHVDGFIPFYRNACAQK